MAEKEATVSLTINVPISTHQKLELLRNQLGEKSDEFYSSALEFGGAIKEAEQVHEMAVVLIHSEVDGEVTLHEFMDGEELYVNVPFRNERVLPIQPQVE
ncbi:MAG: hypothetical protein Q7T54_00390 [Candidatus Levybacteria bacterium]|nr:hypothetical protein [Candidatus Levybacteria bacterium]